MSDDDWENAIEDKIEGKDEKKPQKFDDEDAVDSDEERKKVKEEQAKAEIAKPLRVKEKKADVDKMWEEKMKSKGGAKTAAAPLKGSKAAKGEALSKMAEADIVDDLFSVEIATVSSGLKTEKNYVEFASQVSEILFKGQTPYNIPAFFKELMRDLVKDQLSSDEVKKILDTCSVLYNSKVAEEKKAFGGKKK